MRHHHYCILILMLLLTACGFRNKKDPNKVYFDHPVEYMNYLAVEQVHLVEYMNLFSRHSYDRQLDSARISLDSLRIIGKRGVEKSEKLADYRGDTLFREAAGAYFAFVESYADTAFPRLLDIYAKDSMATAEDRALGERLIDQFDSREKDLMDNLKNIQEAFMKKFNIQ